MFFLDHLTELSKIAGNHKPKSKTLIHSIHLKKNYNHNKPFKKVNKITRNTYLVNFSNKLYFSNTIISKLVDLNFNKNRFKLNNKTNYAIKKKKILFFGISSNLAQATLLFIKKFNLKIFSFSLNKFNSNYKKNKKKLEIYLLKIKPDYIFYFSSPRIIIEKKFDSFFEDYNDVYYKKFKLVLNIILKNNLNSIIFYPSSFFLDKTNSFVRFKSYIKAKKKAENLYRIKKFQKHFKFYRLPQFKTRSTYNMLGYYSGIDLFNLKKYLEDFFLTKQ